MANAEDANESEEPTTSSSGSTQATKTRQECGSSRAGPGGQRLLLPARVEWTRWDGVRHRWWGIHGGCKATLECGALGEERRRPLLAGSSRGRSLDWRQVKWETG